MPRAKIAFVVGTRPEVIKTAPVILQLKRRNIPHLLIATGQHREMMDQMLEAFELKPDRDLDIMRPGAAPEKALSTALNTLVSLLRKERPSLLMVQGDTNSALAGALAARQLGISLGHIEAGLRSGDWSQPFTEEINRRAISAVARLHFAPTKNNRKNLIAEGVCADNIFVTGNTVVDALDGMLREPHVWNDNALLKLLRRHAGDPKILLTVHRRENFGSKLTEIFSAVKNLLRIRKDLRVFYPVHLNPRIKLAAAKSLRRARIHMIHPLSYLDFVHTMARMNFIMTDSGGIQEEAPSLGIPVLLLRKKTDRPESVKTGDTVIAGTASKNIFYCAEKLLKAPPSRREIPKINPFGDGKAAPRIARVILKFCA